VTSFANVIQFSNRTAELWQHTRLGHYDCLRDFSAASVFITAMAAPALAAFYR